MSIPILNFIECPPWGFLFRLICLNHMKLCSFHVAIKTFNGNMIFGSTATSATMTNHVIQANQSYKCNVHHTFNKMLQHEMNIAWQLRAGTHRPDLPGTLRRLIGDTSPMCRSKFADCFNQMETRLN